MTNILLSIIIVLLIARFILSVWQGKKTLDKAYAKAYDVENCAHVVLKEDWDSIADTLESYANRDYELVCAQSNVVIDGDTCTILFFTRKRIKNYME